MYCVDLTVDIGMRSSLRRLISVLDGSVTDAILDRNLLKSAKRNLTRLNKAYESVVSLVEILLESSGIIIDRETGRKIKLPGFLFDMNRFFQNVLSRFLRENLSEYIIHDEFRLKEMMSYLQGYNPQRRKAPSPRPDFVIQKSGATAAILDAKYRDIWTHGITRDILYQLSIYALSQELNRISVILYPYVGKEAGEERIEINDPVHGSNKALIILRPVDINRIHELVIAPQSAKNERRKYAYARYLAFGEK
jgi:5-methylcytosine-specific restriction enzyme subunit McrC